jgi:tetratricopeptide (TPR) repeat protein
MACLKRLLTTEPANPDAWLNLGVSQFRQGLYAQGLSSCRQALELDSRNRLAMYNLALAHDRIGQYEVALSWARRALELEPRDATLQRLELRLRLLSWFESMLARGRRRFDLVFSRRR